ncbi:MAG: 3-phosphoglycerate dehydrogenase [Lachnospiraceae bacterium]|nr:3-phosphoglycerate dehydrogenase [Lachnospiraceae bacterium]
MFKYHCLNSIAAAGINRLGSNYVKVDDIKDADCVLVRSGKMHGLTVSNNLLAVARAGAGVNNIPIDEYAKRGIVVFNTPGANANGVKELVIAALLYASRGIVEGINWVNSQKANKNIAKDAEGKKKDFSGTEIERKRLGVIGLGAIGVKVANSAVNLGMEVYGYDPYISVDAAWHLSRAIHHVLNVEEIYANCDFITIHVPLMESTKKMVGADAIKIMKDDAVLLNFARDELVDEAAVVSALKLGKLKRYVSDFPNPTVVGQEGCIVTPHLGASTEESEENCAIMAVQELNGFMENGNIINSVNFPRIDMGMCEKPCRIEVFHENTANKITKFSAVMGDAGINIAEMANKSKGDLAVSMFDLDSKVDDKIVQQIESLPGVIRVRVIK